MAPPPATIAQIHERFPAVAFAGTPGIQQFNAQQTTLGAAVSCRGIGLHSGAELAMRLVPAAADTGIVFIRTDIADRDEASIPALFGSVCDVTLSTKIGNSHGHVVGTIEHLLAALAGMRVDNVIVEIDGPEVPIMDGSAQPFVDLMHSVGIVELDAVRRALRVKKPVRVSQGDSYCELLPEDGCVFEAEIDFQSGAIGRQAYQLDLLTENFDLDVAGARTFCMLHQVEAMHSAGLALGGSIENAILVDGDVVMNEEG
ncbi:MAG: UDP-3-O-acyl-N-acetylglucosamine deacetylase, partial [Pseudomonadota bacterium]|nr:UDP-3-O-acyl-N-acetylglucosamine deacetylase [Pseudomonadota bacterium]